ncbi:FAD-dependent oxidoreductase [Chromobacterium piscinae]|uniref:FAD-dependent oxidoreductase n=1 Tax=Chromobacterium piscinae TaxID=686831 RepID=UPI003260687B
MAEENFDIAIVGGGVSGVYCAWRLKQTNPGQKIAVFEASDHIGGRPTWWRSWAACASCPRCSRW